MKDSNLGGRDAERRKGRAEGSRDVADEGVVEKTCKGDDSVEGGALRRRLVCIRIMYTATACDTKEAAAVDYCMEIKILRSNTILNIRC